MVPLMKVRIRDAYVPGRGSTQGKIFALASVVDEHDKPELNAGALQGYLAEAVWFPTALLPDEGVKWSAIDNSRALITLTDSRTTISLEFHFNDVGEITGVFTPGRYREVNRKYELTPWAGHLQRYEERGACGFRRRGKWSGSCRVETSPTGKVELLELIMVSIGDDIY